TDGVYDAQRAAFTTPTGRTKCFVASDHVDADSFRGLAPADLFDLAVRHGMHFDQSRQTGVVFHMLAALGSDGRVGLTAVEEAPEAAHALYERTVETLKAETAGLFRPQA